MQRTLELGIYVVEKLKITESLKEKFEKQLVFMMPKLHGVITEIISVPIRLRNGPMCY